MRIELHLALSHRPQQLITLLIFLITTHYALAQPFFFPPSWFSSPPPSLFPFSPPPPVTYYTNAGEDDSSIIVFACVGFVLILCFMIFVPLCLIRSRSSGTTTTAPTSNVARPRQCGVDQSVIETFPLIGYEAVKHLRASKTPPACAICLSDFLDDDILRILPGCRHVFHANCIGDWLAEHKTCPICRSNLSDPTVLSGKRLLSLNLEPRDDVSLPHLSVQKEAESEMGVHDQKIERAQVAKLNTEGWERFTLTLPEEVLKEIKTVQRYRRCASEQHYRFQKKVSWRDSKLNAFCNSFNRKRRDKEENKTAIAPEESEASASTDVSSRQLLQCPVRSEDAMLEVGCIWKEIDLITNLPVHEQV